MSQYLTTVVQTPAELLLRTNVGPGLDCAVEFRADRWLNSREWDDVFAMLQICRRASDRAEVKEDPPADTPPT